MPDDHEQQSHPTDSHGSDYGSLYTSGGPMRGARTRSTPVDPPAADPPAADPPAASCAFTDAEVGLACLVHLTRACFTRMQAQSQGHSRADLTQLLDLQQACIRAYADRHGIPHRRLDAALASVAGGAFAKPHDKGRLS